MNDDLSKRVLGQIMGWDDDRARDEYRWLEFFSSIKYDGYRDFQAGMRFIESLVTWLQQFEMEERETAYGFVRTRLVFIGLSETQHLVEQFYPKVAHVQLTGTIASRHDVAPWVASSRPDLRAEVETLRRKTLFLGLSDGARIDTLRHSNVGRLSNEQVAPTTQLDPDKWRDLLGDLRASLGDLDARFEIVYLIDDFTATGTSFLRHDKGTDRWKGKLTRFRDSIAPIRDELFAPGWRLCVHHYIASHSAEKKVRESLAASSEFFSGAGWGSLHVSFGTVLPEGLPVSDSNPEDAAFLALARKYYDPSIETTHTKVGGVNRIDLGYGGCALPVVLEHNTPNNSVALLWAESNGGESPPAPAMRPLFRRRQRHV
ncbi:phosphoribosyltransferase-like protein [Microbacterium aurum]